MKRLLSIILIFSCLAFAKAQQFENMQEYLNFMDETYSDIAKRQWKLTKAVAHSKKERKIERRKSQLLKTIDKAIEDVRGAGTVGGDEFKEETLRLLQFRKDMLNEEFAKVIDMQEIASQSYDAMEAFILAQEALDDKNREVQESYSKVVEAFAEKNNINFVENENDLGKKMRIASEVFDFKNELYLFYFKAYINEVYLFESLAKGDINGIQQNFNVLKEEAAIAINKLENHEGFNNNKALPKKIANKMETFLKVAEKRVPEITDFLVFQKDFEKLQATIEKTPERKRTKKMIKDYNKKVNEINKKAASYNKSYEALVNSSNSTSTSINEAFNSFVEKNVPQD
jgi:hypothetical protein